MDNLSESVFRSNLNTRFKILRGDDDAVELELVECNDLGTTPKQEQFALIFRGPLQPPLEQMMYEMNHEKLGHVAIFIVPVKHDADSLYYEAVFNRFTQQN